MSLEDIKVPLYYPTGKDFDKTLIVNGQSGLCWLTIKDKNKGEEFEITIACHFDDLKKAWNAVDIGVKNAREYD